MADLGRQVHCSPSHLARMERAERPVPAALAAACDKALDAEGSLVRLHGMVDPSLPAHVSSPAEYVVNHVAGVVQAGPLQAPLMEDGDITVPVLIDGSVIYVQVPRRQLLRGIGAGLGMAAFGAFATQSASASGATPIEHFRTMRATLADSDNLFGPARVISAVREQLDIIQQLRSGVRGRDLQNLAVVQTEFGDLLSWLHQDLGDHQASLFWIDRTLEWSYVAADPHATAFILARKAQLACDMNDGATAAGVADVALRMARPSSRVQAVAAIHGAHGLALVGDKAGSARNYDIARAALADLQTDDGSPYGMFLNTSYLQVHEARSHDVLGDHQLAAAEIDAAVGTFGSSWRRDAGVYLARAATAHARAGDADQAAAVALRALSIGAETGSGRALSELADTDRVLGRWATQPEVRQFHDALITYGGHTHGA